MDINYDYNAAFKGVSVKLKKRFLRKPNVSEAIDEYTTLSRQLEADESHGMAGYCMQQVAKCYHNVGNTVCESGALQQAAHLYLDAEIAASVESAIVTFSEDLLSAISLYEDAIRLHCDQQERALAAKLCLELADILATKFDKYFESIAYYEKSIALFASPSAPPPPVSLASSGGRLSTAAVATTEQNYSLQSVFVLFKLATLKVFTCDYSGALSTYTEINNWILSKCVNPNKQLVGSATAAASSANGAQTARSAKASSFVGGVGGASAAAGGVGVGVGTVDYCAPIGVYSRFLVESDICKLLLLLYLKPTRMKPEQASTIEVYSWFQTLSSHAASSSSAAAASLAVTCMDRDLFILLQSFVMACQSGDVKLLNTLQTELWPNLNEVQNYLVNMITDQLVNSSYTDDLLSQPS